MAANSARQVSIDAFNRTLAELRGRRDVTEKLFADTVLQHLPAAGMVCDNGWYDPPPNGISVLFATARDPSRISFDSLRHEDAWPSGIEAEWHDLLLFFYTSACPLAGGSIGDVAITLYLGQDQRLLAHYKNCLTATMHVLETAKTIRSAKRLFDSSSVIFAKAGLMNTVVSKTDVVSLDLGHSFPVVPAMQNGSNLTAKQRDDVRTSRRFLNAVSDWQLDGEFSVEPQLRSLTDASLPQMTFHFRMTGNETGSVADPDIGDLIAKWMRLS